ncbi:GNAT family N-acetyltransferase [Segeticoccus rhizosphaerae]|uniref:GNAT family N-acetyltransferase n=1 Tax=Segeticoccus rhizosphaerae TaxID=1104777 RepID=UPI001EE4D1D9|nr:MULTISPECIES: GNAT family N-acetyltransferase [Intrasporangiaceae]
MSASEVTYRKATLDDVSTIVALLMDDPLGAGREDPDDLAPYARAFAQIATDPHQVLAVAERDGVVVGTLQLTTIPGLSRRGTTRAQVEGVRVRADERGTGLGTQLIEWAVEEARRQGCALIQLTSDSSRAGAHRFYERLGFTASHVGFKREL